jgi:hypothetical protein
MRKDFDKLLNHFRGEWRGADHYVADSRQVFFLEISIFAEHHDHWRYNPSESKVSSRCVPDVKELTDG